MNEHFFDSPVANILVREIDNDQFESVLKRICITLNRDVNFGTHAMDSAFAASGLKLQHVIALGIFRSSLANHDAISSLIANAIDTASLPLVRTSFELCLFMSYLTEKDSERRAILYFMDDMISELDSCKRTVELYENLDSITEDYAKQAIVDNVELAKAGIEELEKQLQEGRYSSHYDEYHRTKKDRHIRFPSWYNLYDGPRSLKALSEHFELKHFYTEVYGLKSRIAHGKSSHKAFSTLDGQLVMKRLRVGSDILFPVTVARTMFNMIAGRFVEFVIPSFQEKYHEWRLVSHEEADWIASLEFVDTNA
ncbi:MAG: hypothetical protein JJ916_10205 [Phycisphaerales bacterium]|nr:hypothetical protein [Phycisphaerales bacterium]